MTYYFSVIGQFLECTNSKKVIVSDSINFHTAHFTIDSSLDEYSKSAIFTNTRTKVSVIKPLDVDNNCIIPFEPLVGEGYLDVCIKATLDTSVLYTDMGVQLVIYQSGKTDASDPLPPNQSVYDEILEIANDKYVEGLFGTKAILPEEWNVATEIFPITSLIVPVIVTSTTVTLRTGTFDDYLDRVSYPYGDFYMDYSLDGIITSRVSATSETGTSPSLRRINFIIGANQYELRVTSSSLTLRRTSGSTPYYTHAILLRFDDYFYYDYEINNLTTKYQTCIQIQDTSKVYLEGISFTQYPPLYNGYIRLNFSQRPLGEIDTKYFGFKTDKDLPCAEWKNTYGDVVFRNITPEPIDDLVTTYDSYVCTVAQIKEYVNSKLI